MPLLYIDPGTGSILFSLVIGLVTTAYFFLRTVLIRLKYVFSGGTKTLEAGREAFVIYNEGPQYWNTFKPVLEAFEERQIRVLYLTSAENDQFFNEPFKYVRGEFIGTGNRAFARLNMLKADICLLTTPGLEVYQLKRSKEVVHYSHILHDIGDVSCYRLFGIDWFDSILLSGEYQKKDIRRLEQIRGLPQKELVVTGSAYLDVLAGKKENNAHVDFVHAFTVLVSPSWGPGSLLQIFGEKLLDPLSDSGWKIIVRPHPQSKLSESATLSYLENRYAGKANIVWDYEGDNFLSLSEADIMISDFSSIIFDFLFLFGKPVLYSNVYFNLQMYDASDLDYTPWKFEVIKELCTELQECHLDTIQALITSAVKDPPVEKIETAKNTAWQHRGACGRNVAEYLINKQREIRSLGRSKA